MEHRDSDLQAAWGDQYNLAPHTINVVMAALYTISSGEVALPFSQEEAESACIQDNPLHVLDLLMRYPEFIQVAIDLYTTNVGPIS